MIKHKKSIRTIASALLLTLFLALIPLTFSDHADSNSSSIHRNSDQEHGVLTLVYPNDAHAAMAWPSLETEPPTDISPFVFLLAGGFGVAVVGAVSIMVLRMGPEKP